MSSIDNTNVEGPFSHLLLRDCLIVFHTKKLMNHSSHALNARKIAGFTIKLGTTPHWFKALDGKNEDTTFGHFDPFRDEYFLLLDYL